MDARGGIKAQKGECHMRYYQNLIWDQAAFVPGQNELKSFQEILWLQLGIIFHDGYMHELSRIDRALDI